MLEPVPGASQRDEWDEYDWEHFLRRADARTAKYQELFETLSHHPERDSLIAHEMGWEQDLKECGGNPKTCPSCAKRVECEAYEMLRLMSEPETIEDDPDADDLIACFEQLRGIPAYTCSQEFAARLEDKLTARVPSWAEDEDARAAIFSAQLVPAQVAGGHGIGYERDSLCGNIANCKRALLSLKTSVTQLKKVQAKGLLASDESGSLCAEAQRVSIEINRWVESLRARIWWR